MKKAIISLLLLLAGSSSISAAAPSRLCDKHYAQLSTMQKNHAELDGFKNFKKQNPHAKVVIVTDEHDVLVDRKSGDWSRFQKLTFENKMKMLWNGLRFGSKYIPYKMFGSTSHPAAEHYLLPDPNDTATLKLISPFTPNLEMFKFYQNTGLPVFICSNIGEHSYEYLKDLYNNEQKKDKALKPFDDIFKGAQIATKANGYMQKDKTTTFQNLIQMIEKKLGYKPDAYFMVDDKGKNICTFQKSTKTPVFGYIFEKPYEFIAHTKKLLIK